MYSDKVLESIKSGLTVRESITKLMNEKFTVDSLTGTEFIAQLPNDYRDVISDAIKALPNASDLDLDEIMSGRLTDLEPDIDWRNLLKREIKESSGHFDKSFGNYLPDDPEIDPEWESMDEEKDAYEDRLEKLSSLADKGPTELFNSAEKLAVKYSELKKDNTQNTYSFTVHSEDLDYLADELKDQANKIDYDWSPAKLEIYFDVTLDSEESLPKIKSLVKSFYSSGKNVLDLYKQIVELPGVNEVATISDTVY